MFHAAAGLLFFLCLSFNVESQTRGYEAEATVKSQLYKDSTIENVTEEWAKHCPEIKAFVEMIGGNSQNSKEDLLKMGLKNGDAHQGG